MIRPAGQGDWNEVRKIFREYAESLPGGHICFTAFEEELAQLEGGWYSGVLLAVEGQAVTGCVAVRALDADTCELKRLYIRPTWRGMGLGRHLVDAVIEFARGAGFRAVRLDTLPEMASAQALYRSAGFRVIPPYADHPAGAICMELAML